MISQAGTISGFFMLPTVKKMWQVFLISVCLVLVIEGLLPFLAPKIWRETVLQMAALADKKLRILGLCSMLAGTIMLYFIH